MATPNKQFSICARKMSLVECRVRVQSLRARVPRGCEGEGEENPVNVGRVRFRKKNGFFT